MISDRLLRAIIWLLVLMIGIPCTAIVVLNILEAI